jgi:hypothetical protein
MSSHNFIISMNMDNYRTKTKTLLCVSFLMLFSSLNAFSQTILISGTVLDDASSASIAKATVALKVAAKAVLTDEQGRFSISQSSAIKPFRRALNEPGIPELVNGKLHFKILGNFASVSITIYDVSGRLLSVCARGTYARGEYIIPVLNKKDLRSGVESHV